MKQASLAYKQALAKQFRDKAYGILSVGVVNKQAQADVRILSENYLSNGRAPLKLGDVSMTYASFEENHTSADGSYVFPPENNELYQNSPNVGAVSEDILGGVRIKFGLSYDIKGLTIDFGKSYPTEFTISNGKDSYTYTLDNPNFTCTDTFDGSTYLDITPIHFINGDNKRLRINYILMGVGITFDNDDIVEINFSESVSYVSEELPSIQLNVKVIDKNRLFNVDDTSSFINYLVDGQELEFTLGQTLEDGSIEYIDMPKTYLTDWQSNGFNMSFTAADRIQMYDATYSAGNTIHERTLYDDAIAVLTDMGLEPDEYYVDTCLQDVTVTNPLPTAPHKECLQLIANAGRCSLEQSRGGKIMLEANFENIIEPTDLVVTGTNEADWSIASNTRFGSDVVYADFTKNFVSADGSMLFLPENSSDYLDDTGFVSQNIADDNGNFFDNIVQQATVKSGNGHIQNGVTWTNKDDILTANGSLTSGTTYSNYWFANPTPIHLSAGTYYLSGCPSGGSGTTYRIGIADANNNWATLYQDFGSGKVFTLTEEKDIAIFVQTRLATNENLIFKPMLVKVEQKNSSNLIHRPFYSARNSNPFVHNGITFIANTDNSITANGTASNTSFFTLVSGRDTNIKPNTNYALFMQVENAETNCINIYERCDVDGVAHSDICAIRRVGNGIHTATFTTPNTDWDSDVIGLYITTGYTVNNVVVKVMLVELPSADSPLPTEYECADIIPTNYQYGKKPSLTLELPAAYTYYGMSLLFNGNHPANLIMNTYYDDTLLDTYNVNVTGNDCYISGEFIQFNKVEFVFTKGYPRNRILVNKIALGEITEYRLTRSDMTEEPVGYMEKKVKDVQVKIFSFTEPEQEGQDPQQVEDSVFYKHNINSTGTTVTFENQLIGTQAHAQQVAEWMANYYANNITYQVAYRGDPRLDASDIIFMDSELLNNLQVDIESLQLKFNGAYSGKLNLRRATNMLQEE